jgi:hypothetical protein
MTTSSPHYSQGNEKAESTMKIAKLLIKNANKSKQDIGSSPNQRLIGRRTRCDILMTSIKLKPEIQGKDDTMQASPFVPSTSVEAKKTPTIPKRSQPKNEKTLSHASNPVCFDMYFF